MAITPNHLIFSYQKGDALPVSQVVNYPDFGASDYEMSYDIAVDWLTLHAFTSSSTTVTLNTNSNNLSVGRHTATITVYYQEVDPDPNAPETEDKFTIGTFTVEVNITEALVLSVSPSNLSFSYQFGGDIPAAQTANIVSENAWTITETKTWLDVSVTSGTGNGSFVVSVVPTGLSSGSYTENIIIDDGVTTKSLPVTLVVSEADTGTDFLYVSPLVLNFGYTMLGITPPTKRLEINSSDTWTATTNQTWVNLLTTTASAGVSTLDIGLQNLTSLTAGTYYADVSLVNGDIVKTINIELEVYELAQQLLDPATLYFSDDNNIIEVSSGRTDTFLQIKVAAVYLGESYSLTYNNPFFKGSAEKRFGDEAKIMIGDRPFVGVSLATLFTPYTPVYLNLEINEKEMFSDTLVQTINLDNIGFVKGERPTNNWLSDLPTTIYTTKTGIAMFSFLNETNATINTISVTGAVTQTFTFSDTAHSFYTIMLPLSLLTLEDGDVITITAGSTTLKVVIIEDGPDQTFLFWENQYGCWDVTEFTGEYKGATDITRTTSEFRKDYKTNQVRVLNVTAQDSHSVYTGYYFTAKEVESLNKALQATNQYLYKNNVLYKVNCTTKKLPFFDTQTNENTYNLTFENSEI